MLILYFYTRPFDNCGLHQLIFIFFLKFDFWLQKNTWCPFLANTQRQLPALVMPLVSFIALKQLAGWQENHPACTDLCHLFPDILQHTCMKEAERVLTNTGSPRGDSGWSRVNTLLTGRLCLRKMLTCTQHVLFLQCFQLDLWSSSKYVIFQKVNKLQFLDEVQCSVTVMSFINTTIV